MSGLQTRQLSVSIAGNSIVESVDLSAARGQITGLIGPNGAGKSTLFQALIGARPASGEARFENADLLAMPRLERARLVALVEQSVSTDERLAVREVVSLGRIPWQGGWTASDRPDDQRAVEAALGAVGFRDFASRDYNSLSGGERQMAQIARALAQSPQLFILDEPTNHLDLRAQMAVFRILRQCAANGAAVLISLHDLNQAARHCDRLVVMSKGRVAAHGAPQDVLSAELLRDVYGVEARLIADPAGGSPIIVPVSAA